MRWVAIVAAALLVGLLAYGVASQGTDHTIDSALRKGKLVDPPTASLPRLPGAGSADVSDFRGKVVLVNFWASWCPPCKDELPLLERTQQRIAAKGGTVLGINTRDPADEALQTMRRYGVTYPNLKDGSGDYAERWGITGQPESYLLDRDGRVVAHAIGPVDQAWLDAHVKPLLS